MNQIQSFTSGQELANLVVNSGLLNLSHKAILDAYEEINLTKSQSKVSHRVYKVSKYTIITFVTSTAQHQLEDELVLSVEDIFPQFKFQQTSIAIHKAAITLFASYHDELLQLKATYGNSSPLIITGHSLGGSIASLFTLWLLENVNEQNSKRPLCITFGAPLLGDKLLQKLISEQSKWNSSFLHVAATRDQIPRLFLNNSTTSYKPFGMYLFCSESGCSFFENSEGIANVLLAMNINLQHDEEFLIARYGDFMRGLESGVICRGVAQFGETIKASLRAGMILQFEGIGLKKSQKINNGKDLIIELERLEQVDLISKRKPDPGKKLNEMKLKMAQLEWYKKKANNEQMCYYDSYKNKTTTTNQDVLLHKRFLNTYWKKTIEESNNPRSGVAMSQTRWLFGGTCYRRMVEPFDIAEFYKVKGNRDYMSKRSEHYTKLEELLAEVGKAKVGDNSTIESKKENVDVILTEDSCFWARVEEALISVECLRTSGENDSSREELIEFEKHVLELLKNYTVSPEIFFPKSSFMEWWRQYEKINKGRNYNSGLTEIMRNGHYIEYAKGQLEL